MSLTRRNFFFDVISGLVALHADRVADALSQQSFAGAQAGAQRTIDNIAFRWCPAGRFTMGSPANEAGRRGDEAQVAVQLTRGYWLGQFEVTQGQWKRIVGEFPDKQPSAEFGSGDDFPAYWINYLEAETFCARLTQRARLAGSLPPNWHVRLPTEAEWEYACRAGRTGPSGLGDTLSESDANYGSVPERPQPKSRGAKPVGSYRANAWGIHDMHGNVWEWCRDYYHAQLPGGVNPDLHDALGVRNGDGTYSRVRRGGAWVEPEWASRSAMRLRYEPPRRSDHIGFRVGIFEA